MHIFGAQIRLSKSRVNGGGRLSIRGPDQPNISIRLSRDFDTFDCFMVVLVCNIAMPLKIRRVLKI